MMGIVDGAPAEPPAATCTLTVSMRSAPLGPLEVEIMTADREPIVATLSSSQLERQFEVPPGRYTIVGRRANGQRLIRRVDVAPTAESSFVDLSGSIGASPNEFMHEETMRGEVAPIAGGGEKLGRVTGLSRRNIEAISQARNRDTGFRQTPMIAGGWPGVSSESDLPDIRGFRAREIPRFATTWQVRTFARTPSALDVLKLDVGPSFLKVAVGNDVKAVGLIGPDGRGPIVMVPPVGGCAITFLAEGIAARAPERYLNPTGQRLPIALANLPQPVQSDLLTLLAEPLVSNAADVWNQTFPGAPSEAALFLLSEKLSNPGAALLGGHYLLRFLPEQLPIAWADNLARMIPDAIDGPIIAAWARLSKAAGETGESASDSEARVVAHIANAARRPFAYFSRARVLLRRALDLDEDWRDLDVGKARNLLAPYLDLSVGAGGLEAFWGADPLSPAQTSVSPDGLASRTVETVQLQGSTFTTGTVAHPAGLGTKLSFDFDLPGAGPNPLILGNRAVNPSSKFEDIADEYVALLRQASIRPERLGSEKQKWSVLWYAHKIAELRPRYDDLSRLTKVPWFFIGILHALECTFDFGLHLFNGDPLTDYTKRFPPGYPKDKGLPPFKFEDSAQAALAYEGFIGKSDWSLARTLYRLEAYNGMSYRTKHAMASPYLWSFSTHYEKGKFKEIPKPGGGYQSVFDPDLVSKQCGAALMLKALVDMGLVTFPDSDPGGAAALGAL